MPRNQRFRWRDEASYAPIALVGGALIAWISSGLRWNIHGLLHGALIGFVCFSGAVAGPVNGGA